MATDTGAGAARARTKEPATVIVVAGPTGSGKSALALDLADAFDGTVVNADSMQVYAELSILTARPTPEEEARTPHRLFGVLSAAERCSAGRWLRLAVPEIEAALAAGRTPIVVGGTGLYLGALTKGIADVPEVPEAAHARVRTLHADLGGEKFRDRLAMLDPDAASRLPASDSQRLIRAYAVAEATGRTLADWQRASPEAPALDAGFKTVVLMPPRPQLYAALDARFEAMMAAGAVAEVRALAGLGLDLALPAMKAVGVRQLLDFISGVVDLETAVAKAKTATRQYAKRQVTWLRHRLAADLTVESLYGPTEWPRVRDFLASSPAQASAQFSESS